VRYAWMKDHQTEFPVSVMCKFMKVTRSSYYDWLKSIDIESPKAAHGFCTKNNSGSTRIDFNYYFACNCPALIRSATLERLFKKYFY
jgi:hypothetical protein